MAIFKVPRITTVQRVGITLEPSEIVYDTNQNKFYGGDGTTVGGKELGSGGLTQSETFVLTSVEIASKQITLANEPLFPFTVSLLPVGGIHQINGIDFQVTGAVVSWSGLGLDNFLEVGDTLIVQY